MEIMPRKLTVLDNAVASDGGSLFLSCVDSEQRGYGFHLNWSIEAKAKGTMQLYVNGATVSKASLEEAAWLSLLADAEVCCDDPDTPDEDYTEEVRSLVVSFISLVQSDAYQKGEKIG